MIYAHIECSYKDHTYFYHYNEYLIVMYVIIIIYYTYFHSLLTRIYEIYSLFWSLFTKRNLQIAKSIDENDKKRKS
jgi:hypothetical protein